MTFIKPKIEPVLGDFYFPETQVNSSTGYVTRVFKHLGRITCTGGFMESNGHSMKPMAIAIYGTGRKQDLVPSHRNLGIDYVVYDRQIKSWYPGVVTKLGNEGGYGLRCHIESEFKIPFEGKNYTLYCAYAHAESFSVKIGSKVLQGQAIGIQGHSGGNYAEHVDFRTVIVENNKLIDVSPNYIDKVIKEGRVVFT